ncbi:class II aldolase/adducin family protein [Sneathiella sp. P13V-1]|uniref:class II aldolase/adducin family protein n=1 Tax=Sneathiella sp. P13V-1 TaxID=2697366 RepID=UPI00187B5C6C|nr:class II aldolase/adducin family protein [Sneathiella sp. P13V-1]
MSFADKLLSTARKMNEIGLNHGSAGNVSVRCEDGYLITPTGMAYDMCSPEDMVQMDMSGGSSGRCKPSSEWRFHQDLYASRSDIGAIVHTHSTFATAVSCLQENVPAFHYMVAVAGGKDIRCTPYFTFGTEELSQAAVEAMKDRKACLLGNHGLLAVGEDLPSALAMALEIEKLCEAYAMVRQLGGGKMIDDVEMDRVIEKFKGYGQFSD